MLKNLQVATFNVN